MSAPIITSPIGAPLPGPALTAEQRAKLKESKLASLKSRVAVQARRALEEYDRLNKVGIAMVHSDPDFTPAEGLAALGEDAVKICLGSRAATEHIGAQATAAGTTYIPPVFSAESEAALAALFSPQ